MVIFNKLLKSYLWITNILNGLEVSFKIFSYNLTYLHYSQSLLDSAFSRFLDIPATSYWRISHLIIPTKLYVQ